MALVGAAFLASIGPPANAGAAETVTLHTSFSPDRLGASTTIGFGFDIAGSGGVPSPLESLSLRLPAGINYLSTTLGLAICQPAALLAKGLAGCSPNSRLGHGSAYVEVPFGAGSGREIPDIEALMGPPHGGNIVVLFYANGREPVDAQIVFEGELIAGSRRSGEALTRHAADSERGGRPARVDRQRQRDDRSRYLTYYKCAWTQGGLPSQGASPSRALSPGRLSVLRALRLPGRHQRGRKSIGPCPPKRRR